MENLNNDRASDKRNNSTTAISRYFPTSVVTIEKSTIHCYPNLASVYVIIEGSNVD